MMSLELPIKKDFNRLASSLLNLSWLRIVVKFGWGTVTHAPAGFARNLNRAVRRCESTAAELVGARADGFENLCRHSP
jgi:hypothetical protein